MGTAVKVPRVRGVPSRVRNGRRVLFSAADFAQIVEKDVSWVIRALEIARLSFFPHAFMNAANEWMIPVGDVRAFLGGREEQLFSMPTMAARLDVDYEHFRKKVQAKKVRSLQLRDLAEEPLIRIPASEYWRLCGKTAPAVSFSTTGGVA